MIKIIFFDVDGTLLDYGNDMPSASTMLALHQLQDLGIKIVIATGRPPYAVHKFPGIHFNGMINFNGSLATVEDETVYEHPINPEDIQTLYQWTVKNQKPIVFAGKDEMKAPFFDPTLEEYMNIACQHCEVLDEGRDFKQFLDQPIFQGMIAVPVTNKQQVIQGTKSVDMVGWYPTSADLIPLGNSKGEGVKKILDYYGFSKEEAMAFGDGDNDLELLKEVGVSIAMGNGTKAVKEAASYITHSVKTDGIAYALKHFGIL